MPRHVKGQGRHERRPKPVQGWTRPAVEETGVLEWWTVPTPAPIPPQPRSQHLTTWLLAGLVTIFGGVVMLIAVLALALVLIPPPAAAGPEPTQTTAPSRVVVRNLCPAEDSCSIDYRNGTWTIERTTP